MQTAHEASLAVCLAEEPTGQSTDQLAGYLPACQAGWLSHHDESAWLVAGNSSEEGAMEGNGEMRDRRLAQGQEAREKTRPGRSRREVGERKDQNEPEERWGRNKIRTSRKRGGGETRSGRSGREVGEAEVQQRG